MKLFSEHFITAFPEDTELKERYIDEVWDMLEKSYASIGGTHSSKQELMMPGVVWKLIRRNGIIIAAVIYKLKLGRKAFLAGQNGSAQGKSDLFKIMSEDLVQKDRNAYQEVSEAPEHILLNKLGGTPIPNYIAKKVLEDDGKPVLRLDPDGFHYDRKIGNDVYTKVMVGNIKL